MRYGVVIDQHKCMGCHACSVACKAENDVPLGVYRTWVKYVEKGAFPHTRRHFLVNRCNHCDNPPCVAICPVGAMYQRKDGIVDFDSGRCVGCKACTQACPYEAIHVTPGAGTVAKCHLCAHRITNGQLPACAAACPQQALTVGDLDDPRSAVAELVARGGVRVRKPERGTRPKVHYLGAEEAAIVPRAAHDQGTYMWAERAQFGAAPTTPARAPVGAPIVAYDVAHATTWDARVPLFFWTKAIAAGVLVAPAVAVAMGALTPDRILSLVLATAALVFLAVTTGVLIWDLGRRERFLDVLLKGRSQSWVARGAVLLTAYGACASAYWLAELLAPGPLAQALLWPTVVTGLGAAGYTAFLLGQCTGRDLWQTPLLPVHFVVQSVLAGGALLALVIAGLGGPAPSLGVAVITMAVGLLLHLGITLGEVVMPAPSADAAAAKHELVHGRCREAFWLGAVVVGGVLPAILLGVAWTSVAAVAAAGALALVGLFAFEWSFIMAGQAVKNS